MTTRLEHPPATAALDELRVRCAQAAADVAAATEALTVARETAIRAALHWRDLDYCRRQGVLPAGDPDLVAAGERAETDRERLAQARARLRLAEESAAAWAGQQERHRAETDRERQAEVDRGCHPGLAAALDAAQAELDELNRFDASGFPLGRPGALTRATYRRDTAREALRLACASTPTVEEP